MKFLLMLLFIMGCKTKAVYEDLSVASTNRSDQRAFSGGSIKPKIEVMIFFLWPKDLNFSHEQSVVKIISTSRNIALKKDLYLRNKYGLESLYEKKSCDCHILGLCDDDLEISDELLMDCEDIVNDQDANKSLLLELTEAHEIIKSELQNIGAINIDVGMDKDFVDIGNYDQESRILHLNKVNFNQSTFEGDIQLQKLSGSSDRLSFEFKLDNTVFSGNLTVTQKEFNLNFQGDVETDTGYRGLIYWEHLK